MLTTLTVEFREFKNSMKLVIHNEIKRNSLKNVPIVRSCGLRIFFECPIRKAYFRGEFQDFFSEMQL